MSSLSFRENASNFQVLIITRDLSVAEMITISLQNLERFQVIGEASAIDEGLRIYEKFRPPLIISGLELGGIEGPAMLRRIRTENPAVQILIYTGTKNLNLLYEGLEMEPRGFVHKSERLEVFNQAVMQVSDGISYLSPYATALLDRKRKEEKTGTRLTSQEATLVQLIAQGSSTKQIASQLYLSPKTVEHYRKQIMQKLGLNGIAALTVYAVRCGMLD